MNILSVITAVLTLMAGIGVFLIACTMMSSNLESASSKRLKRLFAKTGDNKWLGVAIGTVGTAAIQSSGAVTVMVIGFVNVGIMSLAQAATIIYGANIGTTVTAPLVALGMFGTNSLSTTLIFSAFAGIGAFIMLFTKSDAWKQAGGVLTGFGMLFVGLSMMSNAMGRQQARTAAVQALEHTAERPAAGCGRHRHHPVFVRHDLYRHHHGCHGARDAGPGYLPHNGK